MISAISSQFLSARPRSGAWLVAGMLLFGSAHTDAAVINAKSASRTDVGAAVALANDGDTVMVPAGSATWITTLTIIKNIQIIGAGESSTVITENLPRTNNIPLFDISLTHESSAPDYSFRLSGMKITSQNQNGTALASDKPFIALTGVTHATDAPAPYVSGCVSRVRLDHMTWDHLQGLAFVANSCLGVADHITQITNTGAYQSYPVKIKMETWTPNVNPATGDPLPKSYLAAKGFGSWADDPYWGTDKFWFFEDCNFTVPGNTNICDNLQGARVVFRHCTINGGGGMATHGMEGEADPGIKQAEIYNNYFVTDRQFGQHRSGSILYFNNKSTGLTKGVSFYTYRQSRTESNWGGADGTDRYDNNAGGSPIYTGTVTGVSSDKVSSITDNNRVNFNLIDVTDGAIYSVNNLDDPAAGSSFDAGWKYKHASVASINGKTLELTAEIGSGTYGNFSAEWAVGNHYEIRKVIAAYGQPGQGKGNLLNTVTGQDSYTTYTYPGTTGAKATYPQAGYPLEPCYAWNNTDTPNGYLNFNTDNASSNLSLKSGRDYFSLSERAIATQDVGYPAQSYTRATNSYPGIGANGTTPYTPYTYPHPLTAPADGQPSAPENLQIKP
ncbi:MAG: hypothetical protein H0X34_03305 [Chthoniobacterales bacterium]|nr:hypothetical protein [Chthoniobacterales bacterium]